MKNFKDNKGFTIIEVLIVLAIAGLIMLVVFLAVPALQRQSHNQQYKTEANNLLSGVTEIAGNNGGAILLPADSAKVLSAANTKQYTTLIIAAGTPATALTAAQTPSFKSATILTGVKCDAQLTSGIPVAGTTRNVALFFQIESASSATGIKQCLDS